VTRAKSYVMLSARSEVLTQAVQASLQRHSGLLRREDVTSSPSQA
jgi:hypothetical protein